MIKKTLLIGTIGILLLVQSIVAQTWTASTRLTWNTRHSWYPVITTDSNNHIHVVWEDYSSINWEIYYKRSTDAGTTWTGHKRLSWNSGHSDYPVIAADSNNYLHVAWQDDTSGSKDIYYKHSTDGGTTWSKTVRLTWTAGEFNYPDIAVGSNNHIHVVCHDDSPGNREIYYMRSMDGGATWSGTTRLTWNSSLSYYPAIAADSNNHIHVVWRDFAGANREIYYKHSTDGGTTWTGQKRITWNSGWSEYPSIAVDTNNYIHVAWRDSTPGNYEIYYKKSMDGGTTWTGQKRITWNSGFSNNPSIAAGLNNHLHIAWCDSTPGNAEIYYKMSTDTGATWIGTKRLTWNSGDSFVPSVGVGTNNNIHVVWQDATPGNAEIYYKKGIQ